MDIEYVLTVVGMDQRRASGAPDSKTSHTWQQQVTVAGSRLGFVSKESKRKSQRRGCLERLSWVYCFLARLSPPKQLMRQACLAHLGAFGFRVATQDAHGRCVIILLHHGSNHDSMQFISCERVNPQQARLFHALEHPRLV